MRTAVGPDNLEPPAPGTSVAIGTFDGVHVGHRSLIARALDDSRRKGTVPTVVTWDRHPLQTLKPEHAPPLLTTAERKAELIESSSVELLCVLPFDSAFSKWPPERFVTDVLTRGLDARSVFVGEGWRFGHKAAGDVELLADMGRAAGFYVEAIGLAEVEGQSVSSSRIREAVAMGDMDAARTLLGRPFDVDGIVVRGADRGAGLGFPTANLAIDPSLALPRRGIYAGRGRAEGDWYPAAIDVGVNPTFGGDPERNPLRVEAFLLDFGGNLYGRSLRVEFWARLRDETKFTSVDELVAQMQDDVRRTRELTC